MTSPRIEIHKKVEHQFALNGHVYDNFTILLLFFVNMVFYLFFPKLLHIQMNFSTFRFMNHFT
jgi:hypothetical protein